MAQLFPTWANKAPRLILLFLAITAVSAIFIFWFWLSPWHLEVGYRPIQPIPFSHKIHAGKLRMNCIYCHSSVEKGPVAGVPPMQTCINCHIGHQNSFDIKNSEDQNKFIKTKMTQKDLTRNNFWTSFMLEKFGKDEPINWIRVHKVPDYAYFDHSAHISTGIGCVSCHGRIDRMDTVKLEKPLSMGWCLDCHRNPKSSLRPLDKITDMEWIEDKKLDSVIKMTKKLNPPIESCSGCHR